MISDWVENGGVLLLMANDSANVELKHFNELAANFGIHFNNDLLNHVSDDRHLKQGAFIIIDNPVIRSARKIFMKDICSLSLSGPAYSILKDEYTNGRLPKEFQNDKAADDVAKWLIGQVKK